MAVEEITLTVPDEVVYRTDAARPRTATQRSQAQTFEHFVQEFVRAARRRDGFAFTKRGRQKRRERFDLASRALIKSLATEASKNLADRSERLDLRTRIYGTMLVLIRTTGRDQIISARRARALLRWAAALALLGGAGVGYTLLANGWIG